MTIKFPETTVGDKFLALMGKKRAIRIPTEAYKKLGPYIHAKAERESFWRALFRSKKRNPPAGWIYPVK
jgi:hypothetical protein